MSNGVKAMQHQCENETPSRKAVIAIGYTIHFIFALVVGIIYVIWLVNVEKISSGIDIVCRNNPY